MSLPCAQAATATAFAGGTHWQSVKRTMFGWNNETLNAWTMLGGVVLTLIGLALGL